MNRRLYRSRTDRIVGGAAAGLADYMNTDPALVRIAWAILVPLTGGVALLAYIAALIVVPEAPKAAVRPAAGAAREPGAEPAIEGETQPGPETGTEPEFGAESPDRDWSDGRAGILVGIGLVLIGLWFLLREYLPDINWGLIWPLIIVGIGAVILFGSLRRRD